MSSPVFVPLHNPHLGYRLLAWTVAGLMLFHGVAKLMHGVDGIAGMLTAMGLPGFLAYGVYIGEVIAPALVLSGFFVAPAALVMAVNMLVAVALAHASQVLTVNAKTGGYALELQLLFFVGSLVIAMLAPGRGYVLTGGTRKY